MKNYNERIYYIAFNCLINFTYQQYKLLLKSFGSLTKAFFSSYSDLLKSGLNSKTVFSFVEKRKNFDIERVLNQIEKEKIQICIFSDINYPKLLKNIYNPPPLFYYKGNLDINWDYSLSVVGSRKMTSYGEKIAFSLIPPLIQNNIAIISGLAIGIDSMAHRITIDNKGKTIAILGSGLDYYSIYPSFNKSLVDEIIKNDGLVISEFPLKTPAFPYNFPQRNRIIAGLSKAILIIEASQKSGSLITAKHALEEGREVLSVPADIFNEAYNGNNYLIKKGAVVVNKIDDILDLWCK
jgi:DNA processing protein